MGPRVLIVKLSSLGDVLHALPAVAALRRLWPDVHLGWAIDSSFAPLVANLPTINETIVWNRGERGGFRRFISAVRARPWDIALDLQNLFRSALVTRLSGARRRCGVRPSRELAHWFYNEPITLSPGVPHAVDRTLEIVAHFGASLPGLPAALPFVRHDPPRPWQRGPELFPLLRKPADVAAAERWLSVNAIDPTRERLVLLHPHCRRPANVWPAQKFRDLARRLLNLPGVRVALCGGAAASALCDEIAADLGPRLARADGQLTLLSSAELFARTAALVTGDTGPMHIAAAVGTPQVALLGPTDPGKTGPYDPGATVITLNTSCAPCLAKRCPLKFDPPLCMREIRVAEVFAAVLAQLDRHGALPARRSA